MGVAGGTRVAGETRSNGQEERQRGARGLGGVQGLVTYRDVAH